MGKNNLFKRLLGVMLIAVMLLQLCACGASKDSALNAYAKYSVKSQATLQTADGEAISFPKSGKDGDSFTFVFSEPTEINTVVLSEKEENITEYEIAVQKNGAFETVYRQDKVGTLRYCALETVETDAVRVTVQKTREGKFTLTNADILLSKHTRDDFRVTAYMVCDTVQQPDSIKPAHMAAITDIMLFGAAVFDEEGHIKFNTFEINGESVSGEDALRTAIENIRAACNSDKMPSLYINLLGPDGDTKEKEKKHNVVFTECADTLSKEIKALLTQFDVDGVYFDYEYPYKSSGWRAYSQFLVQLDETLGDKKIGIALGPWGGKLSKDAKTAVDYYELMTYDMFDDDGYHATFETCIDGVKFMEKQGYEAQKYTLGIPFYARPLDRSAVWSSYYESAETLGKFGNVDSTPIEVTVWENGQNVNKMLESPRYFNSYQMVYDKTAFTFDSELGGVMVWHYACDVGTETGLSLFDAMAKAIADRQG